MPTVCNKPKVTITEADIVMLSGDGLVYCTTCKAHHLVYPGDEIPATMQLLYTMRDDGRRIAHVDGTVTKVT